MACISVNCSLKICTSAQSFSEPFNENSTNHFTADRRLATRSKQYDIPIQGASNLRNAESCQGVICGKSSADRSANYPVTFPHSAGEKFRISADRRKTTVRLHCTTHVQPMHRSVRHPAVPSFCILCGPFATEQGSFFYNFLTSKSLQHSKCHIISLVSVIGFKLCNQRYSCRHDRTN